MEQARPVLLEVWADWCPPCRQMDSEVWPDPRVLKASEKFVQVSMDISQRDSSRLGSVMLGTYGSRPLHGVPTIVLLDPWGEILSVHEGYVPANELAAILTPIPGDYSSVRAPREGLVGQRDNSKALGAVAGLYQRSSAFALANRYFREALSRSGAKEDEQLREQLSFAVAANEVRLQDWKAARKHLAEFQVAFPGSRLLDQVLFGVIATDLGQHKTKDAERRIAELKATYPASKMIAEAERLLAQSRR